MKRAILSSVVLMASSLLFAEDVKLTDLKAGAENINTLAIQNAIDKCSSTGGGKVIFPSGVFKTGFFTMKDNVVLQLENNTVILGSENASDYPQINIPTADDDFNYTLIYAKNAKNIGIIGGTIRGQGEKFPRHGKASHHRPRNILFEACKNVQIKNCTMLNPAFWNAFFLHCDGVEIDNVRIFAHANRNNDGIDIASKNVKITNCVINATDDAICLKNEHSQNFVVENIVVENCIVASACNLIKIGTGTQSDFRNIKVRNCALTRPSSETLHRWVRADWGTTKDDVLGIAGIALEAVDGGSISDVHISNISMTGIQTAIFIRVDCRDRNNHTGKKSSLNNVLIENIAAVSDSWISNSITAPKGYVLKNVKIKNCMFDVRGGAPEKFINNIVPEPKKAYPENRMFGVPFPAYGFFIRNVENLTFSNVQLTTNTAPEFRHAIYAENAKNLVFEDCAVQKPAGNASTFKFVNTTPTWLGVNIER